MSVRLKVWIAMAALVIWMSGAFLGISHMYLESQFREYTDATRVQEATRWADFLGSYYVEHHSWGNLGASVIEDVDVQMSRGHNISLVRIKVATPSGKLISNIQVPTAPQDSDDSFAVTVPVKVSGKTIAVATVYDSEIEGLGALEETALHSMDVATLVGLLLTGIISLVAAGLLARGVTKPLKAMMAGVRKIAEGNLGTRIRVESNDEFARLANALNEMSRELESAVEARRHLVADVAHELRTPVTIIQGQLDLIQDGLQPADASSVLPIQDEVLRLRTLIDELHQLSLAESKELQLHLNPLDMVVWVQQLTAKFSPEAAHKEISLSFESTTPAAWVNADNHRLTQAVANVLSNAIRYTPPGKSVHVTVSADEPSEPRREAKHSGTVNISIADTGPGIPEDKLPHIFDRFYRTEEARSREGGGLGLGLAIAKELVELHGGAITVESQVGYGTTFILSLDEIRPPLDEAVLQR